VGAFSEVAPFDDVRLSATVAPALLEMVAEGRPAGWLDELVAERISAHREFERRHEEHYRRRRRPSTELEAVRTGLGLTRLGRCELVRADLGVRDEPATLRRVHPALTGSCYSTTCPQRERCPLHLLGQGQVGAEEFMALCRDAILTCVAGPRTVLGRRGQWYDFAGWYAAELGLDGMADDGVDHADGVAEFYQEDPALYLLLRLSRRGAAIGWDDGGFGEGLLGWLDRTECVALAERLASYDLDPGAPAPDGVDVGELRSLRAVVALVRDACASAAAGGLGLMLQRS
jgi:hypothetical protein